MLYDSDKIVALMRDKKLSGNELGKRAGISGPSMHAILSGKTRTVKYKTLTGIAGALGVPIQQIIKAPKGNKSDLQADAQAAFAALSSENQAAMLATMHHLAAQQKKK